MPESDSHLRSSRPRLSTRRAFLGQAGAGFAAAGFGPQLAFAAGGLNVTPVAEGIAMIGGAGGNILVHASSAGKIVVDSGAAAFTDAVIATLAEISGDGVAGLFNTHWHADQVGSNVALGMAGATIYAHEKTRQRLTSGYYLPDEDRYAAPLPPAGLPTESFRANGAAEIGGVDVEYGYLIEAHTDGDSYVAFPESNLIAVGGVLSPASDPVFDWFGGGWLGGRLDSIERLLEISDEDTRFVPSTGPVIGRDDVLQEQALYLELFDLFVEHIRLGETADDMLELDLHSGLGRTFDDPARLFYDLHKGFWAHHNKLMHDIV